MLARMIAMLLGGMNGRKSRRELAEFLWVRVEAQGALILDKTFLKQMGRSRTQVLMALCELLLAERIHLRSDQEGRMTAMSNFEFMRFILNRVDRTPPALEPAAEETVAIDVPLLADDDGEWFAIEVAADLPADSRDGVNLPDGWQILPERRRDPWLVVRGFEVESVEKSEK